MPDGREVCVRWILPTLLADQDAMLLLQCLSVSTNNNRSGLFFSFSFCDVEVMSHASPANNVTMHALLTT